MHKDAMEQDILPDADVVYSPLNRRGNPFIKAKVIGETPKKVRIEYQKYNRAHVSLVEPKRVMVLP